MLLAMTTRRTHLVSLISIPEQYISSPHFFLQQLQESEYPAFGCLGKRSRHTTGAMSVLPSVLPTSLDNEERIILNIIDSFCYMAVLSTSNLALKLTPIPKHHFLHLTSILHFPSFNTSSPHTPPAPFPPPCLDSPRPS